MISLNEIYASISVLLAIGGASFTAKHYFIKKYDEEIGERVKALENKHPHLKDITENDAPHKFIPECFEKIIKYEDGGILALASPKSTNPLKLFFFDRIFYSKNTSINFTIYPLVFFVIIAFKLAKKITWMNISYNLDPFIIAIIALCMLVALVSSAILGWGVRRMNRAKTRFFELLERLDSGLSI